MSKQEKFVIRSYTDKGDPVYLQSTSKGLSFVDLDKAGNWKNKKKAQNVLRSVKNSSKVGDALRKHAEVVPVAACKKNSCKKPQKDAPQEQDQGASVPGSMDDVRNAVMTLLAFYGSEPTLNNALSDTDQRLQDIYHDIENHKGDFSKAKAEQVCERIRSLRMHRRTIKTLLAICSSIGSIKNQLHSVSGHLAKYSDADYHHKSDEPNILD